MRRYATMNSTCNSHVVTVVTLARLPNFSSCSGIDPSVSRLRVHFIHHNITFNQIHLCLCSYTRRYPHHRPTPCRILVSCKRHTWNIFTPQMYSHFTSHRTHITDQNNIISSFTRVLRIIPDCILSSYLFTGVLQKSPDLIFSQICALL